MEDSSKLKTLDPDHKFSGNIYVFHAFDIGDDVNLEKIEQLRTLSTIPLALPKFFKNYNTSIAVELPHPNNSARCISCKIHNFGAISLTYQIPFHETLENLRKEFYDITNVYHEQSVTDVKIIFKRIEHLVTKPKFLQIRSAYNILQINPEPNKIDLVEFQKQFGGLLASTIRFETESLSEYQKNEILDSAIGYYRGNLIIVDTDTTFIYDDDYHELLWFVEFANLQQLELKYFDRLLDAQLQQIYESGGTQRIPFLAYLPIIDTVAVDPVATLGKLKVDISVITERLEGSIKLAGEPYYSEFYHQLTKKLDLKSWQQAIERKLEIIKDIQLVYQHKTDVIRENILELLIVILIFIELVIGILHYLK